MDCATDSLLDTEEFYEINQSIDPAQLKLDRAAQDLLANNSLNPEQQAIYQSLSDQQTALLASNITCPGDGNGDLQVYLTDLDEWAHCADPRQCVVASSWYDFNHDGITDDQDIAIIEANLGSQCRP